MRTLNLPAVSESDLQLLVQIILNNLQAEFSEKKLSGNLLKTIRVTYNELGKISIEIPAEIYNMYQYFRHGVIIHTGKGSYAETLNESGSAFMYYPRQGRGGRRFVEPRNHIGFIDRVIKESVTTWQEMIKTRREVVNVIM